MRILNKLETLYYDTLWGFKNLVKYFCVVWELRPWSFDYNTLKLMQFHLKDLKKSIENGYEVRESADLKIKDISRCIEIIDNILEDDYISKIGKLHLLTNGPAFTKLANGNYILNDDRTVEEQEQDSQKIKASVEMADKEWLELWDIISKGRNHDFDARGWWD